MGLYQKMHAVMCESEAISKEMIVGSGSFSYKAISEAAVLNEIKPLLKKHGLVIFPVAMKVIDRLDVFGTNKGDSSRLMTQITANYKIVDIDTGEFEILETVGNGVDTQDKASGKAITYGYKAMIQKTFCLFSGEDSDNDHSDTLTANQTKDTTKPKTTATKQPDKPTPVRVITPNEAVDFLSLCSQKGLDIKKIMAKYEVAELGTMAFDMFTKLVGNIEKLPDKVETNA